MIISKMQIIVVKIYLMYHSPIKEGEKAFFILICGASRDVPISNQFVFTLLKISPSRLCIDYLLILHQRKLAWLEFQMQPCCSHQSGRVTIMVSYSGGFLLLFMLQSSSSIALMLLLNIALVQGFPGEYQVIVSLHFP